MIHLQYQDGVKIDLTTSDVIQRHHYEDAWASNIKDEQITDKRKITQFLSQIICHLDDEHVYHKQAKAMVQRMINQIEGTLTQTS